MTERLHISSQGLALIKHFESLHDGDLKKCGLQPKLCPAGWWTVGYGRVVIDPATGNRLSGMHIGSKARALQLYPELTEIEAEKMLAQDCRMFEERVRYRIKVSLLQHQFDALVSLDYNTGAVGGNKTVVALVNQQQWAAAAAAFEQWNKGRVDGRLKVLPGLERRRRSERALFEGKGLQFNPPK